MDPVSELVDLAQARAYVAEVADSLDPDSRYVSELLAVVDASRDLGDLLARLAAGSRGARFAGADVFAAMSARDRILCNLITAETSLFRFAEGEIEASRAVLRQLGDEPARVLIVPCSHGEEAFTVAAFLIQEGHDFAIRAFDVQPALIEEARTGRLTFGYPVAYLDSPGYVSRAVLDRIEFAVGDAFALPLSPADTFHVVMCRNFLGYFVPERTVALTRALAARVAPGGRLFLDSFCLGKTPEIGATLRALGFAEEGCHPVFARGAVTNPSRRLDPP
jgi:hypothetical protein